MVSLEHLEREIVPDAASAALFALPETEQLPLEERILEGLDPEQREAATTCADRCACWPARAPARPGPSPTGSPTDRHGVYTPRRSWP